jgi:hypothetical protein
MRQYLTSDKILPYPVCRSEPPVRREANLSVFRSLCRARDLRFYPSSPSPTARGGPLLFFFADGRVTITPLPAKLHLERQLDVRRKMPGTTSDPGFTTRTLNPRICRRAKGPNIHTTKRGHGIAGVRRPQLWRFFARPGGGDANPIYEQEPGRIRCPMEGFRRANSIPLCPCRSSATTMMSRR